MAARQGQATRNTITIYFPQRHQDKDVIGRLKKLAQQKDRSVNYLAVRAIEEYLDQKEGN